MNKIERGVLSNVIKQIRLAHPNGWWELKRQIWDGGFQTYYPAQEHFSNIAKRRLSRISASEITLLTNEWKKTHLELEPNEEDVLEYYRYLIIEELVRRAEIAAYRTEYW